VEEGGGREEKKERVGRGEGGRALKAGDGMEKERQAKKRTGKPPAGKKVGERKRKK